MTKTKKISILLLLGMTIFVLVSCGAEDTSEADIEATIQAIYLQDTQQAELTAAEEAAPPPEEPEEIEDLIPGEPPEPERTLADSDSSIRAYEQRTLSGDKFLDNLYERPFTSQEMVYQPDLDIYTVDFSHDADFYYFTITLYGLNPDEWGLSGVYGIEFDRTKTGRGDMIVQVEDAQDEWSMENLLVLTDENGDVGGPQPIVADAGFEGSGYDLQVELEGARVAYARIKPDEAEAVQFAVSRYLLEDPEEFLWGAWADNGLKDVTMFDYNDTMGPTEAGSPLIADVDYPLNALYSVDNTCRLPYGFEQPGGGIPGICISQPPVRVKKAGGSPRCVCVRWNFSTNPPSCVLWDCS